MNRLETILSHNLPMTFTFAQVFLAALCFYFLVHSVTCLAEIIHLKRTIHEVPEPLREKITLPQHKKAAHYDIARTKLNWLEVTVTTHGDHPFDYLSYGRQRHQHDFRLADEYGRRPVRLPLDAAGKHRFYFRSL